MWSSRYSPAARPSRKRAPPAKKRQLSTVRSISNSMIDARLAARCCISSSLDRRRGRPRSRRRPAAASRCAPRGVVRAHAVERARRGARPRRRRRRASLAGDLGEHLAGRRVHDLVGRAGLARGTQVPPMKFSSAMTSSPGSRRSHARVAACPPTSPRCCVCRIPVQRKGFRAEALRSRDDYPCAGHRLA